MDKKELQVIADLMEELKDQMEYGEDDFNERLGRKKPQVEVIKMEEGEDPEHAAMVLGDDMMSPEEKLKQRLMKLRE